MNGFTRESGWKNRVLLLLLTLIVSVTACDRKTDPMRPVELDEFVRKSDLGLVGYGGYLFRYSEDDCQLSVNRQRKHIRMQNDRQTDYVHIAFKSFPVSPLQRVSLSLSYKVGGDEITMSSEMELVKEEKNKVWLWSADKQMGLVVPVRW